jgi:hypothetical protein
MGAIAGMRRERLRTELCGIPFPCIFAEAVIMWQFLIGALSAIPSAASSGYGFGAYALLIAAYVITAWRVARNKNLLENIQKLPSKDRLSALEIETGGVRLAAGISPEQWVRSKIHRYYLFAFLASCAVVVAIVALAAWNGITYVRTLNIINNEYRQSNNGEALSGADLQHIKELIDAAMTRDLKQAETAFNQLSDKARDAYASAVSSAKDILPPPDELKIGAGSTPHPTALSAQEAELNNSILKAKEIQLNTVIRAAIGSNSDPHYFSFTMQGNKRDLVDIILNNESTTLAPTITFYNPDKSALPSASNTTPGGDVTYSFVASPKTQYYVEVSPYNGYGDYRLTVRSRNAYDAYEPNDDILDAHKIAVGESIKAGIMDPKDLDFYTFESGSNEKLVVSVENRSTTLAPTITVYNPDKSAQPSATNTTPGGDIADPIVARPNSRYYVEVSSYNGYGDYTLTVRPE